MPYGHWSPRRRNLKGLAGDADGLTGDERSVEVVRGAVDLDDRQVGGLGRLASCALSGVFIGLTPLGRKVAARAHFPNDDHATARIARSSRR